MPEETTFKEGDQVRWKYGGPTMIVLKVSHAATKEVTCQWYDKNYVFRTASFDACRLVKLEETFPSAINPENLA